MTLVCNPCNYTPQESDLVEGKCDICDGEVETVPLITLESVSIKGTEPEYTPHGYVILEDGTIYSLTKRWTHGVVLALLYPDVAKKCGYKPPDEDFNVFHYQRFELDNHSTFPVVRVAFSLVVDFYISKGDNAATKEQIEAMIKIFKVTATKMTASIQTDAGEMSARKFLDALRDGGPRYD